MNGTFWVLSAFLAVSLSRSLKPTCYKNEMNDLWPDYVDNTAFYKCIGFGKPIQEKCKNGMWFSFHHQLCVLPSEWMEPPVLVPRRSQQIASFSVTSENLENFGFLFLGKGSGIPNEPSYPPPTSGYPTPSTPIPSLPPTAKPTVPPLASSTFPPKPPTPTPTTLNPGL